jgi:hypothetical protein
VDRASEAAADTTTAEVEHLREAPAPQAAAAEEEAAAAYRRDAAAAKRVVVAPGATAITTAAGAADDAGAGAARARPFTRTGPTRRAAAYAHRLPSAAIVPLVCGCEHECDAHASLIPSDSSRRHG